MCIPKYPFYFKTFLYKTHEFQHDLIENLYYMTFVYIQSNKMLGFAAGKCLTTYALARAVPLHFDQNIFYQDNTHKLLD